MTIEGAPGNLTITGYIADGIQLLSDIFDIE